MVFCLCRSCLSDSEPARPGAPVEALKMIRRDTASHRSSPDGSAPELTSRLARVWPDGAAGTPRERFTVVAEASELLASSLDRDRVLHRAVRLIGRALDAWVTLDLRRSDGSIERVAATHPDPELERQLLRLYDQQPLAPDGPHPAAEVLRTGRPTVMVEASDAYLERIAQDDQHLALLRALNPQNGFCLPLIARQRVLGALCIATLDPERRYGDDDLELAAELARRFALAIDHANLYQEAVATSERLSRLQVLIAGLAAALTSDAVAEIIVTQGVEAVGAATVVLGLVNADRTSLEVKRAFGLPPDVLAAVRQIPLDRDYPATTVARAGEPRWIESPEALAQQFPRAVGQPAHALSRAWAVLPLAVHGAAFGVLSLTFAEPRRFSPGEREFILTLAAQCAQALERARLYEQEQQARAAAEQELAERTRTEAELREREAELRLALDAGHMGVWNWDVRRGRLHWTSQLEALHGLAPGTFGGTFEAYLALIHPDDRTRVLTDIQQSLSHGSDFWTEFRVAYPDGSIHWVAGTGQTYCDATGQPERMVGIGLDITGRKRTEEAQRFLADASRVLAEAHLDPIALYAGLCRCVVESLGDQATIQVLDDDGDHLRTVAVDDRDPAAAAERLRLFRDHPIRKGEGLIGQVVQTGEPLLIPEVDPVSLLPRLPVAGQAYFDRYPSTSILAVPLRTGRNVLGALTLIRRSGIPFDDLDRAVLRDLAERAALAIENAQLYQEAQAAIRSRDEFLSTAAHELKTPMTSLRGNAQLLLRFLDRQGAVDPARLRRMLTTIEQQSVKLARLVGHLLDVSRLDAGKLILDCERTDLVRLVEEVVAAVQPSADGPAITVRASGPVFAVADPLRLEQIIANVLDNAIKFSPGRQPVEVTVAEDPPATALITVTDHGIGIPPEHREAIFRRFSQAHADDYLSGLGLGLYISRQIAELHHGTLTFENPPEGGTRFLLRLPLDGP
jgi:PAS domain S-box-containing protein